MDDESRGEHARPEPNAGTAALTVDAAAPSPGGLSFWCLTAPSCPAAGVSGLENPFSHVNDENPDGISMDGLQMVKYMADSDLFEGLQDAQWVSEMGDTDGASTPDVKKDAAVKPASPQS